MPSPVILGHIPQCRVHPTLRSNCVTPSGEELSDTCCLETRFGYVSLHQTYINETGLRSTYPDRKLLEDRHRPHLCTHSVSDHLTYNAKSTRLDGENSHNNGIESGRISVVRQPRWWCLLMIDDRIPLCLPKVLLDGHISAARSM